MMKINPQLIRVVIGMEKHTCRERLKNIKGLFGTRSFKFSD